MADHSQLALFEARLERVLVAHGQTAVRPIDAMAIAEQAIGVRRASPGARPWQWIAAAAVIALIVVAMAVALIVGAHPTISRPLGAITSLGTPLATRDIPALAVLPDGRVLIAGGGDHPAPIEIFDPATRTFSRLGSTQAVGWGSAVPLTDGTALLLLFDTNSVASSAFVVNAETGAARSQPAIEVDDLEAPGAALLPDGRVLVAGGQRTQDNSAPFRVDLASARLFDPATGQFTATGSMSRTRVAASTTGLLDGRVLVVGGDGRNDAEMFDPRTGTFAAAGELPSVRDNNVAVRLPDGHVVVFEQGGVAFGTSDFVDAPSSVDVFDPATGSFRALTAVPHAVSTATWLSGDLVYVTGRWTSESNLEISWAGIYDAASGRTSDAAAPRSWSETPIRLPDGSVLLVGATAELFHD